MFKNNVIEFYAEIDDFYKNFTKEIENQKKLEGSKIKKGQSLFYTPLIISISKL